MTTLLLPSPFCFFFCCNEEGNDNKATVTFYFGFVVTKKVTIIKLSSPSCFFFCYNEEGDDNFVVVAFCFFFCCNEESNGSFYCWYLLVFCFVAGKKATTGSKVIVAFFCFHFVTMKKATTSKVAIAFFFWFCCNKKGNDNQTLSFFVVLL